MRPVPEAACLSLIHGFEGKDGTWEHTRAQDPGGLWEIGWSHRLSGGEDPLWNVTIDTQGKADALALSDLAVAALGVQHGIGDVMTAELTEGQYAALIDFTYNLGVAQFVNSTLCRLVREGNLTRAPDEFGKWVYGTVDGKHVVLDGLVRRRKAELVVWNTTV